MKRNLFGFLRSVFIITLILFIIFPQKIVNYIENFNNNGKDNNSEETAEFRGVWIATVLKLDYPAFYTTDINLLKSQAIEILDKAKDMGFNAVVFQVRPSADAFYRSNIFPWSKYLTGIQGQAPTNNFDPLAFYIDEAHKRGLKLHAWINPYRITQNASDNDKLIDTHHAKLKPELCVEYGGKLYFNPGIPEARQLIIDGVKEILLNYSVDGIHLDDYFYPAKDFPDEQSFLKYNGGLSLENWRRQNNDLLIQKIYKITKELKPKALFGVSPAGIWANKSSNPLGSDTSGGQTYYTAYADTRGWVKKGWLDYIAPQIYWQIGYSAANYHTLANWWAEVVSGTKVKLYIGQAAYRAIDSNWGVEEINKQIELNRSIKNVNGYIMFRYAYLNKYSELYCLMKEINKQ